MAQHDGILGRAAYSDAEAFTNFLEAIKVAESAAKQLAFYREQPAWLHVENSLAGVRQAATQLAIAGIARAH
jgi:hypothetical protein